MNLNSNNIKTLNQAEKMNITKVLRKTNGHITLSSKLLGVSRSGLYNKLRKYKIDINKFRIILDEN